MGPARCRGVMGVHHRGYDRRSLQRGWWSPPSCRRHGCYLASTKRIKAQMEVVGTSRAMGEPAARDICALEVPEESLKKGRPHEEIRRGIRRRYSR
ncbi:hypothetical protein LIER_41003 [Lithospermum erythrorhizon]|uniref:Uncharacterized protein n=1 Tax=Lithospermum erythrorhizon TaxID=34254 RepID=A0AAV3R484_LITER